MKFNSAICTSREQSERLLALGLKKETADMAWVGDVEIATDDYLRTKDRLGAECPAWSLHRLLYLIPNEYFTDIDFQNIMERCIFATSTLYNDLIELIEALIKEGYFYKEYLEEYGTIFE